jgi:hypothetical protein
MMIATPSSQAVSVWMRKFRMGQALKRLSLRSGLAAS